MCNKRFCMKNVKYLFRAGSKLDMFLDAKSAHEFLRVRRANTGLEEMKPGNLEQECKYRTVMYTCTFDMSKSWYNNDFYDVFY